MGAVRVCVAGAVCWPAGHGMRLVWSQPVELTWSTGHGGHREDTVKPNLAMLDERKAAILETVVSEYITTAQPVSSSHVASVPGVGVSAATVRSEMVVLEAEGYLIQPHTSAGRIPTDKGYRFFVDRLVSPVRLRTPQQRIVEGFFASARGELDGMLEDASRLLARLTDCAAVVTGPAVDTAEVRSVQFVSMSQRVLMAIVVLSSGVVEKRTLELEHEITDEVCAAASSYLSEHAKGRHPASLGEGLRDLDPAGMDGCDSRDEHLLVSAGLDFLAEIGAAGEPEQVYVEGASRMVPAFDALDTVQSVIETLEEHCLMTSLFRRLMGSGQSVAIGGTEHGMQPLSRCAVVVAPYDAASGEQGAVGLLGPTRMDYRLALAAVAAVGSGIARRLALSS